MTTLLKTTLLSLLTMVSLHAKEYVIDQKDKTFMPNTLTVSPGDTITFKNSDPFAHNAYSDNEANEFDINMQPPGTNKSITVKPGGDFNIECAIHPNMLIEVKVK